MVDEGTDVCFESSIQSLHITYIYIWSRTLDILYRSAAKERPSSKEHLYFWPNSLYRVKGYLNKRSPWSNLRAANTAYSHGVWEAQPRALCTSEGYYKVVLRKLMRSRSASYTYTMCRSECCALKMHGLSWSLGGVKFYSDKVELLFFEVLAHWVCSRLHGFEVVPWQIQCIKFSLVLFMLMMWSDWGYNLRESEIFRFSAENENWNLLLSLQVARRSSSVQFFSKSCVESK